MTSTPSRAPLGHSFKDPAVEAGLTVTALQSTAVRFHTDGTISPAWLSTSASKRKTVIRIGRSAPRSAFSFMMYCSTKWKAGPTMTDRPDARAYRPCESRMTTWAANRWALTVPGE